MTDALILGGTGVIGRAIASHLAGAGWHVEVTGRDPANMPDELVSAGVKFTIAERADSTRLHEILGSGRDLLVDCLCYTGADAQVLVQLAASATSTVLMSSKAVYVDAHGNHANSDVPPRFDGTISESTPTMAPGDLDYRSREGYGANKVAAERTVLDSGLPISVLRPSLVHGVGSRRPREWVFVKRAVDRRPHVLLARRGEGMIHPTAAANIAALVESVAIAPAARVLNVADPDCPSATDISRLIARHLGHEWDEVPLDDTVDPDLGITPWDAASPVILDMSAASALGYQPVGDYSTTVLSQVDWLVDAVRRGDPGGVLPQPDDPYFAQFFDYQSEDRFLANRASKV